MIEAVVLIKENRHLRAKLAGEVGSSAMLADLLEKLNGMPEAQARPADFRERFDAFVARVDEYRG
jgi:hypothetical protein